LWVEAKNITQISAQILALVNDKLLQSKMGHNNRILSEKFTAQKIVGKVIDYLKLV
jgi:hypothetical protein